MKKIKVLSLFSGIGAFEKALKNIGVDYELVNYCEIDKYASKCYSLIHDVSEDLNLWDVTKINSDNLEDFDLLTHGSPCQSFSIAGKQEGGIEGSGTKSSLMWETVRIIKDKLPKYVIWENVKNVVSRSHIETFNEYIKTLEGLGYSNYYKVLNSCNFGVAQNRERIFVVSCLGDENFNFPKEIKLNKGIKDYLESSVDESFYVNKPYKLIDKNLNKINDFSKKCNEVARLEIPGFECAKRVYDVNYCCPTLSTRGNAKILEIKNDDNNKLEYRVRKLTPIECWRLQSFDDEDFYRCKSMGVSNCQLYKQAGNSITVKVLEEIFKELFNK